MQTVSGMVDIVLFKSLLVFLSSLTALLQSKEHKALEWISTWLLSEGSKVRVLNLSV